MQGSDKLAMIDQHFVDIYGAARAQIVDEQKQIALIVIQDDDLLLYRTGQSMERFSGLMPPLYNKMKTVGHIPLAIFCLLYKHTDKPLPEAVLAEISAYRAELKSAAGALDTREEARADILPNPNQIYAKATGFLDAVIAKGSVSKKRPCHLCRVRRRRYRTSPHGCCARATRGLRCACGPHTAEPTHATTMGQFARARHRPVHGQAGRDLPAIFFQDLAHARAG
jgi:hypothetical protein